jgi:hypothetical protein
VERVVSELPELVVLAILSTLLVLLVPPSCVRLLLLGFLTVLPDCLLGVSPDVSLAHCLPEHPLHLLSGLLLVLISGFLVLLLTVEVVHELFPEALIAPAFLFLVAPVL